MPAARLSKRLMHTVGYPNVANLPQEKKQDLRSFWLDGVFAALAGAFANSYHTLYLLSLGATSAQIGLVSTLSQLAAGMSIPGAMIADRTGRYKHLVLQAGIFNRLMWPVMVLSPLILGGPAAVWVSMLALVGISAFGNLGQPAWAALSAEFVPGHMRGAYFASRNIAMQIVQLAAIPAAGQLVNYVGEPAGFQINFLLAFAISLVSLYFYSRISEHAIPPKTPEAVAARAKEPGLLTQLRGLPTFVRFTVAHATLSLGVMIAGPFFQVYMAEYAGFDPGTIGIATTVNVLATLIGMRTMGRIHDRLGPTRSMYFGVVIATLPVLWLGVLQPWQACLVQFIAGLTWSGYNLGAFNLLLGCTPDEHRPRYVAIYTTFTAFVSAIGPTIGGWLIDMGGFVPTFSLSTIVRALGLILFIAFVREARQGEPRPADTHTVDATATPPEAQPAALAPAGRPEADPETVDTPEPRPGTEKEEPG